MTFSTRSIPMVLVAIAPAFMLDHQAVAQGSDDCASAVPQALAVGASIVLSGDNSTANGIGDFIIGSPYDGAPVYWVKFTTDDCANVSVAYCGQSPVWGNSFGILANSCPADVLAGAGSYNDVDCGDGNRTYYFNELPAGTWSLPVLNDPGNNASGAFAITVTATACAENNDLCTGLNAQALDSGGSLTFSADNSTASGVNDFDPGSPYFGAPVFWHAFTTTDCNNVRVAYCGTTPAWSNVFGILATDCPALNTVGADLLNTTDCGDGNTTFTFDYLPAGTYYLPVVNDVNSGSSGPYTVEVSATACAVSYDLCANAVPEVLASGGTLAFSANNSTAGSTNDFDPGSPYFGAPVNWHAFTTTDCNNVRVAYCGTTPAWSNVLGILATDCPALTLVNASVLDNTACGDGNTTFIFNALPAGTYYLPVLNDVNSGSSGLYTIGVEATACAASNDLCANAVPEPLASGGTLTFNDNNSTAGSTNDFDPGSPYFGTPVYWHAFTTTTCNNVRVAYCGTTPAWSNVLGVLSTDCPALSLVGATSLNNTLCGDGNTTFTYEALPAGTYYLPVLNDVNSGSSGPYTVEVAATDCAVSNDLCFGLVAEPLALGGSLTFSGDNTNATGDNDFVPGNPFGGAPVFWHLFSTLQCADVSVAYCGISPVWGTTFGWLTPDCPADSLILFTTFSDDTCGDGNRTYYWNDLLPGTYAIPIVLDPGNNSVGPYSVVVSADDCLSTGLTELAGLDWSISPNPSEGNVIVRSTSYNGAARIEVIDATGRIVGAESTVLVAGGAHQLRSAADLFPGSYTVRIMTASWNRSQRLVVR